MLDHHWDAVGARLRAHRARRLVVDRRRRHPPRHRQRRREGPRLAAPARHRHARPRLDAVRRPTTRSITAAEVVRRLATYRPAAQPRRPVARPGGGDVDLPDEVRAGAHRPGSHLDDARATRRRRLARMCPRLHAHDDLAERRPRRPEDEHDPRRHRHRRRHPHRARRHQRGRRRRSSPRPSASWPPQVEVDRPAGLDGHRLADRRTRCGTRSRPARRSPTRAPSWSPGSSSAAPTPASSASRARSPTAPGCSRRR